MFGKIEVLSFCSLFFLGIASFGQNWTEVKLDDKVAVRMPVETVYGEVKDEKSWVGEVAFGVMDVRRISFSEYSPFADSVALFKFYESSQIGNEAKGMKLLRSENAKLEGLLIMKSVYALHSNGIETLYESWVLFLDQTWYSFSFQYLKELEIAEGLLSQKRAFFSGIKIVPSLGRSAQYEVKNPLIPMLMRSILVGVIFFSAMAGTVLLVLRLQRRKRMREEKKLPTRRT